MSALIPVEDRNGSLPAIAAAAVHPAHCPELAKALAAAQHACGSVAHDEKNAHHGYAYTSAEAIIAAGKQALFAAGLALLPVRQSLNGWERSGVTERFELERHFLLLHSSGECMPLVVHWPVVPDRGRPLDKATAAAATLSLSYLLRDLLLMPRVDRADDVSARDDRPRRAAEKPATAPKEKAKSNPLPKDGRELYERLTAWCVTLAPEKVTSITEVMQHLKDTLGPEYGEDVDAWGPHAIKEAVKLSREFVDRKRAERQPAKASA